jgi:anti-sigma-K factor RskA
MTGSDPHVRTDLGAYVLGALEPVERHRVERHLADCASCRDELSRLSALPALLDRLSPEEAMAGYEELPRLLPTTVERASLDLQERLRRQVRLWRASASVAAAAAVMIGLLAWAPWRPPPDRIVVEVVPLAQEAQSVEGTVAAYAWEWGTTVEIQVQGLPPADGFAVWAISDSGDRERAGTWGPTRHRGALVRGASAIQRDQLVQVEITDRDGAPLFAASFDETPSR